MIEAHAVGRVRGKFDQVVFELCYEEDSVNSFANDAILCMR